MPDLTVTMTPTDELVPYAGNAKEHPDWQVEQIAASISEFGFNDPVAVWHDADGRPVIVEGHGRVLAAQQMGLAELPTIALDHLTDAQRRAYVHVHNQTTLTSGFDMDALQRELASLPEFDWEGFGFELDELLEDVPDIEEDEVPEAPEEPRTKPGDLWQLGRHRLLCGDSTDRWRASWAAARPTCCSPTRPTTWPTTRTTPTSGTRSWPSSAPTARSS